MLECSDYAERQNRKTETILNIGVDQMKGGKTLWTVIREGTRQIEQIRPTQIRLRVFIAAS